MPQRQVTELHTQKPFSSARPEVTLITDNLKSGCAAESGKGAEFSENAAFQDCKSAQGANPKPILFVEVKGEDGCGRKAILLGEEGGSAILGQDAEARALESEPQGSID
jgi:hypothetical protein